MKVRKDKFDSVLTKLLSAAPKPRKQIKTNGKHGKKRPLLSPQ